MDLDHAAFVRATALLKSEGITLPTTFPEQLSQYLEILIAWNPRYHLVSSADHELLLERHVVDSMSLLPYIAGASGSHLDIGSGGGFPLMILTLALPEKSFTSVERSSKKVGFLTKVKAACGIVNLQLVCGSFPQDLAVRDFATITARAVEKPGKILDAVGADLGPKALFLCQSGDPRLKSPEMFHVERVDDLWISSGLRRGNLDLVRRVT